MTKERVVQNDVRERMIASHCGLTHKTERAGPDAVDERGNWFELKSATKTGITTARDVGEHTIKGWRKKYWIIAVGKNLDTGFKTDELYIAHPDDLAPRFDELESELRSKREQCERVIAAARKAGANHSDVDEVTAVLARGITKNNPKIPIALVRERGTTIDPTDSVVARRQVREFVEHRPITG